MLYDAGPCPYLPDRRWVTRTVVAEQLDGALYEHLISHGWRRSGTRFYQNHCPGCRACVPLRIPVDEFRPSRSQRRIAARNRDVSVTRLATGFREESYQLFQRYDRVRHGGEGFSRSAFRRFLCEPAVPGEEVQYRLDGRLIGIGWIDVLPDSLSSVYFAFDPDFGARSLGTFSVLVEVALARDSGLRYHHLGFTVEGSRKMAYKASFFSHEQLVGNGRWFRLESRQDLAALSGTTTSPGPVSRSAAPERA